MLRSLAFLLVLIVFWAVLSGRSEPFLIFAGVTSAIAVTLLARRMDLADREGFPIHLAWRALFSYWPWLLSQILTAAWAVSRIVLAPRLPISPTLVEIIPSQRTDLGLAIHANSITLTPGTIAVEVEPEHFLVHALTRASADALRTGEMDRRVQELERDHLPPRATSDSNPPCSTR